MSKIFFSRVCLLSVCLFLFECQSVRELNSAHTQKDKVFETWEQSSAALKKYNHWHAEGKIGFTFPYEGKRKAVSANIDWQQNVQDFDMVFSGPLGMGRFTIEKRSNKTVLTNHEGEQYIASSPEALFDEHTGMQIPWSDLAWWVRALPAPQKKYQKQLMKDSLLIEKLEQSGWIIDYSNYETYQLFQLPKKIKFSNGEINATFIVRNWELIK